MLPAGVTEGGFYWTLNDVLDPLLRSVSQPAFEMRVRATELIFNELTNSRSAFERVVLESKLIVRGSI